ncbi:MAG: hypothetical protein WBE34_08800 [Candidatus Nitrosopolaris sp.]
MPDAFEVMAGTSLPLDSFAVKCCCAKAGLVMIATMPLAGITQ